MLSRSGYEVVFIDINQQLLHLLNENKQYNVVIKSNRGDEVIQVTNVRGIHLRDTDAVINELADAYIKTELIRLLPGNYPVDDLAGLVETGIGKMVPILCEEQSSGLCRMVYTCLWSIISLMFSFMQ